MRKLIEYIESLKLTRTEICKRMDEDYKTSRDLYQKHAPVVKELYYKENPEEIELNDFSIDGYVYLYSATTKFKDFKRSMTVESEDRNSKVWDYIMDNLKELYKMERLKYQYRAYESALKNSMNTMGYGYYDKDVVWEVNKLKTKTDG